MQEVIVLLLALFCATLILHGLSSFFSSSGAIARFAVIFAAVLPVAATASLLHLDQDQAWALLAWYVFLCELYVFLFTLSLGAVSIKILKLLRVRPMSDTEISACYPTAGMVDVRLHRLEAAALVERIGEEVRLSVKGSLIARCALLLRRVFHSSAEPKI